MAENAATPPASSTESAPADSQPPPSESSSQTPPPSEESSQSPPPADASSQSPPPSDSSTPPPTDSSSASTPPPDSSSTSPSPPTEQTPETPSSEGQSSPPPPSDTPPSSPTPNNKFSPPPPTSSKNHSPPPPRSLGSHRSSDKSSSGDSDHGSSTSSALMPAVVGAMVGMGVLLILGMLVYLCACRKKKRSPSYDNQAYSKPGSKGSKGQNFKTPPPTSPMNWQQYNASPGNLATPPGQVATSPRGWPSASPQPVPPFSSSGEMSGGFSGSQGTPLPPPHPSGLSLGFSKAMFSYEELAEATNGFAQSNLIGQGGFGYVHQGVLPNGKEVAVKSLKKGSGQGDREFQAEVEIISRVHHRHLVSLVGYSIAGGQRLLAYEFIPNNTLEFHLHGKGNPTMDWPTRLKIAIGAAKGFAYLHEDCHPRIIHRDIKAANILLDYNFEAKVADFGLAKLTSDNNTHVSTRVMGTFGYLAPEYASSGKLTDKSDVFSFGVMLLELISGRRPVDNHRDMDESLVDWARPLCTKVLEDGKFDELADPFMEGNYNPQEMARMVACAGSAVKHSAKKRPKMSQIVRALEGDMSIDHLNEWVKGGELRGYTSSSSGSYDMESSNYSADMRKFRKVPMDSREYQSSEFGNTSEYGLNPSSSSSENNSGSIRKLP